MDCSNIATQKEIDRGMEEYRFLSLFNKKFEKVLERLDFQQDQLKIGSRLRPRLTFWGYLMTTRDSVIEEELEVISDLAICVELIHKASIILDDYFDMDDARHGKPAFHKVYGSINTILFSNIMVNEALSILSGMSAIYKDNIDIYLKSEKCLLEIVSNLSHGCLMEVNMGKSCYDVSYIKNVMEKETSSLLTNSFLLGYYWGCVNNCNYSFDYEEQCKNMLNKCGYIFQLLNDMEPFWYSEKNSEHKGRVNADFTKLRKNITIAFLYNMCTSENRIKIEEIADAKIDNNYGMKIVSELLDEYCIHDYMYDEVDNTINCLSDDLHQLNCMGISEDWCREFKSYIDVLIEFCKQRID